MPGICGYVAYEAVPYTNALKNLLDSIGDDGNEHFGCVLCDDSIVADMKDASGNIRTGDISSQFIDEMKIGDSFIASCGAAFDVGLPPSFDKTIEPIIDYDHNIVLTNKGSVLNSVYNDLSTGFNKLTNSPNEAIIWGYLKYGRNMLNTLNRLGGSFSFLFLDLEKEKLFCASNYTSLYYGYLCGYGLLLCTSKKGIFNSISSMKGNTVGESNCSVWDDYYCKEIGKNTLLEIDVKTGAMNTGKFNSSCIRKFEKPIKKKVFVMSTGDVESTCNISVLKSAGYDVTSVFLDYGEKYDLCRKISSEKIASFLKVPFVSILASSPQLTDSESHPIDTIQSLLVNSSYRNSISISYLAALGETFLRKYNHENVFINTPFLNGNRLSFSPLSSERFTKESFNFISFGSDLGYKLKPLYACSNLFQYEQYFLLLKLGVLNIVDPWMLSCSSPILIDGIPHNCSHNKFPACNSGILSLASEKLIGVSDKKRYFEVDSQCDLTSTSLSKISPLDPLPDVNDVIVKLRLHDANTRILKLNINHGE